MSSVRTSKWTCVSILHDKRRQRGASARGSHWINVWVANSPYEVLAKYYRPGVTRTLCEVPPPGFGR